MNDSQRQALEQVEKLAGSQTAAAERLGTSQSQWWYWTRRSKKGPPGHIALMIENEFGVSRSRIRPDIYPPTEIEVAIQRGGA